MYMEHVHSVLSPVHVYQIQELSVREYFTVHNVLTVYLSSLQLSKTTAWDVQTGLWGSVSDTQTIDRSVHKCESDRYEQKVYVIHTYIDVVIVSTWI